MQHVFKIDIKKLLLSLLIIFFASLLNKSGHFLLPRYWSTITVLFFRPFLFGKVLSQWENGLEPHEGE